jgi:hypothetical protein
VGECETNSQRAFERGAGAERPAPRRGHERRARGGEGLLEGRVVGGQGAPLHVREVPRELGWVDACCPQDVVEGDLGVPAFDDVGERQEDALPLVDGGEARCRPVLDIR